MPSRKEAVALLEAWVVNENLRKHMLAVEAVMRHYARLRGADEDEWGFAGLLHDLDWEKHPDDHPLKAVAELESRGYSGAVVHAILAHRSDFTGVEPESELDRVLFACDELTGLVHATCLVRPTGVDDLTPKSVTKKLKDEPDGEVGPSSSPQLAPMTTASRNIVRLIASPRWEVNDCSRTNVCR